jgi:hypothetical protein
VLAVITGILIGATILVIVSMSYLMYLTEGCEQSRLINNGDETRTPGSNGLPPWTPAED